MESVLKMVPIHSVEKISKCHLFNESGSRLIQTEGLNIEEVWRRAAKFDMRRINVTDVHAFAGKYGVG